MANSVGTRGITEYDINVNVESEDGRLRASSRGKGVASISMTVDRASVGVLNTIKLNPLSICFTAQVPEDLPGTKKCIAMAKPLYPCVRAEVVPQYAITIDQVPGHPINLATELFDINAQDINGALLVATVKADGSLVGDIDVNESSFDASTGKCTVTFTKPLMPEQGVTVIKRFTNPSREPLIVVVPDLVPYESKREYHFPLKVFDPKLNQHFPIKPGTLTLTAMSSTGNTLRVTDDGAGALIGNIDPSGANTINYDTGEVQVTFSGYIKAGTIIHAEHASLVEVFEFQKSNVAPVRIKVELPWEDLARIVKSVEQAADAAETNLKYRANT